MERKKSLKEKIFFWKVGAEEEIFEFYIES